MKINSFKQFLIEKLILFSHGKKYGQIVIMCGGAGSGKGYAVNNFIETDKFKQINVDQWKKEFLLLAKLKNKYPEIKNLSLSNKNDVKFLHQFIKKLGIKGKVFSLLFGIPKNPEVLPNILFDITGKNVKDIISISDMAKKAGYKIENIHILYILTQWKMAYKRNLNRSRIVASSIFLCTHRGATATFQKILKGSLNNYVDGAINIVLNNPEETDFYTGTKIVKDFSYINIKKEGKPIKQDKQLLATIENWLRNNAPRSAIKSIYDENI